MGEQSFWLTPETFLKGGGGFNVVSCIQSCLQCPMRIQLFNKVSETNLTCRFVQTSEFFSIVALADVNECGTPYMGILPE